MHMAILQICVVQIRYTAPMACCGSLLCLNEPLILYGGTQRFFHMDIIEQQMDQYEPWVPPYWVPAIGNVTDYV